MSLLFTGAAAGYGLSKALDSGEDKEKDKKVSDTILPPVVNNETSVLVGNETITAVPDNSGIVMKEKILLITALSYGVLIFF